MGNPKKNMELINPNCSAVRLNCSPSWGKIPALMEKVKAVVISAKQLPLNNALLLMFSFNLLMFKLRLVYNFGSHTVPAEKSNINGVFKLQKQYFFLFKIAWRLSLYRVQILLSVHNWTTCSPETILIPPI